MLAVVEVSPSVAVRRLVAAADVPAGEADPQVYPVIATRHALRTNVQCGRLDVIDEIGV
jgi:hypothetical protein